MAESYLQRRARELGVSLPGVSASPSGSSYLQRRAKELGVDLNPQPAQMQPASSSALERRRIDLGITPETRPERLQAQQVAQSSIFNIANAPDTLKKQNDARKSNQAASVANSSIMNLSTGKLPKIAPQKNAFGKWVDKHINDPLSGLNRALRPIDYPFAKAAENMVPAAPFLDGQPDQFGATNPRDSLIAQHAQMGLDTSGNKTWDKVGGVLGTVGAFVANPAKVPGISQISALPGIQNLSARAGAAIPEKLGSRMATGMVREGLTGAVQGAQYGLQTGDGSFRDVAENALMGATGGTTIGGIGGAIGRGIDVLRLSRAPKLPSYDGIGLTQSRPPVQRGTGTVRPSGSAAISRAVADNVDNTARPLEMPTRASETLDNPVSSSMQERGFVTSLKASEKASPQLKSSIQGQYQPITNAETVNQVNNRLASSMDEAAAYVMSNTKTTAEKVATGLRLIDEYTAQGNHSRAVEIAEKLAEEGTKAGQSVQAFSIYNRLSPEGMLIHANRIAQRATDNLPKAAKEIKVTPEMAENITDLAQTTKDMTGVKTLANDVMNILDRAKSGEKLSTNETETLSRFVNESKQFVEEVKKPVRNPKPPTMPKDKRIRDSVVSFMDAQEQAAKDRLRARGIHVSSTPLDVWADYAVIGAAKLAKGTIKFADWSEQMVKDLGEEIRPHLGKLYERSKEALSVSTKKVSQERISTAERLTERVIKNKQLDETTSENLRTLAQQVSKLSGEAKVQASQDLQAILQQLERPGIGKKISSAQTIGQLLNPKTQVRNALGNELFYRVERLNKLVATPIDIARSKLTGSERTVTFRTNNQGEYWKNFISGGRSGWKGVNVNGLETQFDLQGQTFRGKWNPLTYLEKATGAALRSFDNAAYMRAVNHTVGEMATLRAINEGLTGAERKAAIQKYIREADENILNIAHEYGKYATFQDNNVVSKGLQALKRGMNAGKNFGLGDLVIKYPKTPGAIVMRALEYSPAGFLRSAKIAADPWLKKSAEPNTREAVQALSRAIIGTAGLSGLGYYFLDKGIITGSASKDKDIRDLQRSAGQGQYQVNLSALRRWATGGFSDKAAELREGDRMYTYDWMQPVAIAVSMGANIRKNQLDEKSSTSGLLGTAYDSVSGGVNTLVEQSVLSGLKDAAQGYPGQTVTDKIVDILSDLPSSFVPTAVNQYRQLTDNKKRETYDPNKIQQSLNFAKTRVPGLADTLPQQTDTLGRPKTTYQNNSVFNVLLNPGFTSNYELSPEAELIVNLINETGDETLAPRVPSKKLDGQALTTEQFARLQQLQGEETARRLRNINPDSSTDVKVKRVKKALNIAGETAREQLKKEFGLK